MTEALLYQGSSGDEVRKLQQKLTDLGYDVGGVDAQFGPKTAAALQKFQQDTGGLQVDAIAGPQTMSALYGTTVASSPMTPRDTGTSPFAARPAGQESVAEQEARLRSPETQAAVAPQAPALAAGPSAAATLGLGSVAATPVATPPVTPPVTPTATPTATPPVTPTATPTVARPVVGEPKTMADILAGMNQQTSANMLPYETALRDLLAKMPTQAGMTPEQILASAQQYARTITDPQALALQQGLEQLRSSATGQAGQIEAGYAGAEESANRLLTEAEARAVEDSIRRGGGRAGLVPYLQGKYGQPITEAFAQGQAQKAASLADVQRSLGLGESQIQGRQEQLAQTQGQLTAQQQQALGELNAAKATGDWQRAWAATESLMGAATQASQYGEQIGLSILPYMSLTDPQRQSLPLEYGQTYGVAPGTAPGALQTPSEGPVSIREYAAQKGMAGAVDWDSTTDEIIINGQRISHSSLTGLGGYETGGTAYLPKAVLDRYLGLGG